MRLSVTLTLLAGVLSAPVAAFAEAEAPRKIEFARTQSGYVVLRDGQAFSIRGAGLEYGDIASLSAHGGNAIRNWTTDNAREVLDLAHAQGVMVALCLPVIPERHGFDYSDQQQVSQQLEKLRSEVLKYKDHPALLAWIIGNELNFDYTNSAVYDAVNDISEMIHAVDPNHPTTTTVAGLGENVLQDLEARAGDLDFLSFQAYGEIFNVPEFLSEHAIDRPVWITEWGAIGHWEMERTDWGAPLEMNSSEKAGVYLQAYNEIIAPREGQIVGSFAFLWGQKQERTPTWFGMFTESGEETEAVDVMHYLWNQAWPENRSPQVHAMRLDGQSARDSIGLVSGTTYRADIEMSDPDGDPIDYRWELKPESGALQVGGDAEQAIENLEIEFSGAEEPQVIFRAPAAGAYRLYVYGYDRAGHAAHANVPFLVERAR